MRTHDGDVLTAVGPDPVLLIDIGGSKLAVAVARGGTITQRVRLDDVARIGSARELVEMVAQAADRVGWDRPDSPRGQVAVAVPGTIDASGERIVSAANLPLADFPLAAELRRRLAAASVVLEDDANCGVIGEHLHGAGRGHDDVAYLSLSTGVGMGSIVGGALARGASRHAGEVGHMTVVRGGLRCGCGRSGCLEAYFSGRAFASAGEALVRQGRAMALRGRPEPLTGKDVVEAAYAGDPDCQALVQDRIGHLLMGVQAVCAVLDPSVLIFGGGLMKNPELAAGVVAAVRRHARSSTAEFTQAALGDDSVLLGALSLCALPDRGR